MKYVLTPLFFFLIHSLFAQSELTFVSQTDYSSLHNTGLNDVWGYVDEQGNEYAIVGTEDGTSILNVSDPVNPFEVFWVPGENSIWRDPSVFSDYAYISTEAEEGLTIIDLSPLPESNVLTTTIFMGDAGVNFESAHNCHVDEFGYLYVFGANYGEGGVLIYDVNVTPMAPTFVGAFDYWYVHDGVAFGDTLYLAHVNDGFLSIVDISDRSNPQLLGTKITASSFTHNIWPSDNRDFVYTTDELPDSYVAAYDITDVNNIVEVDRVQSSPGANVIPHNTFVLNDYLVTSYYVDGITIHDASRPHNLIEIAAYDTYPGQTPTYDGSWGVYPYLPSGIVLASDRTEGLFVLQPNYERASYLEGIVSNQVTGLPILNVDVDIPGNLQEELSNNIGFYATGMSSAGNYDVTYSKVGYEPQMISTTISQGNVTVQDVQLVPIEPFTLTVSVEDMDGNVIPNANIQLIHPLITYEGESNGIGEEVFSMYYEETHNVIVGKWGYFTQCEDVLIDASTGSLTIILSLGYYDDFTFDFGWTVSGDAETGEWVRDAPNPTTNTVMGNDSFDDCGDMAYVTGNRDNTDPDYDDVDDGITILTSPVMDLTTYLNPGIFWDFAYFCNHGPGNIDDTLSFLLSNGSEQEIIYQVLPPQTELMSFESIGISLLEVTNIDITNSMTFSVSVSDIEPNVNITEAAFDFFRVEDMLGVEDSNIDVFSIYPNPTNGTTVIKGA
jgi:choice-of-anchor B domain-containing protein